LSAIQAPLCRALPTNNTTAVITYFPVPTSSYR